MTTNGHQVAYIRVSSYDQNLERQLSDMFFNKTFEEKASAKDTDRPELKACIEHVREGDTLHVHSIDRLARNLKDLQTIVEDLTKKGVVVRFHKEHLTFTGKDDPMQNLMLQMIGAVAQFERALIRERQREGIANARKKGAKFGAKKKLTVDQVNQISERKDNGEAVTELAKEYGIARQTLYTALKGIE